MTGDQLFERRMTPTATGPGTSGTPQLLNGVRATFNGLTQFAVIQFPAVTNDHRDGSHPVKAPDVV